ncbi:hypothetical protein [Alloactinosynnema sp. L-07]|uniref:hypothetical protein n=1 Tax=Alloactinosynnema sp. L-07 TaxID=1653480 RepID=UPI0006B5A050|nr:hypothetical protein [Alloactinosynnema sp. L-07]
MVIAMRVAATAPGRPAVSQPMVATQAIASGVMWVGRVSRSFGRRLVMARKRRDAVPEGHINRAPASSSKVSTG